MTNSQSISRYAHAAVPLIVIIASLWSAIRGAPHYRLYTNPLASGQMLFPQDELYDAYMQETMSEIGKRALPNARVASELPNVAAYYANRANRPDLKALELSDPDHLKDLQPGDFVIDAHGRTYFSNQALLMRLRGSAKPAFTISVGQVSAADVYILDQQSLAGLLGKLVRIR